MEVKLVPYQNEVDTAIELILKFWQAHGLAPSEEDAHHDLRVWTGEGNSLHLIRLDNRIVGFAHIFCGRGSADSHGDIFVLPEFQSEAINTHVTAFVEDILQAHYRSEYSGADEKNTKPIRLYQEIRYSCLQADIMRKSFRLGENDKGR